MSDGAAPNTNFAYSQHIIGQPLIDPQTETVLKEALATIVVRKGVVNSAIDRMRRSDTCLNPAKAQDDRCLSDKPDAAIHLIMAVYHAPSSSTVTAIKKILSGENSLPAGVTVYDFVQELGSNEVLESAYNRHVLADLLDSGNYMNGLEDAFKVIKKEIKYITKEFKRLVA